MNPEQCTYSFLCIKRTLVASDNLELFDDKVVSWPDPWVARKHPDEEDIQGGFNIHKFSFAATRSRRRHIVCNTVSWCPSCRRFHGGDSNQEAWTGLVWGGKEGFLNRCQSLFDKFKDNTGWQMQECPRCAELSLEGYVYVAKTNGAVKIGISKSEPKKRIASLQTACPWPIELHAAYRCNRMRDVESAAHYELMKHRMCGEWFAVEPQRAAEVVELAMRKVS